MAVFMIVYIPAVHAEIEIAVTERMGEIQPYRSLTERSQSPFGFMMGIYIENRFLAVIQMISEIKQGVRMAQCPADITVIPLPGLKTGRLGEQGTEGGGRGDIRRIFRILDGRRLYRGLHHSRLGGYFACRLDHRLEIPLYSHAAIQRTIGLCHCARN